MNLKLITRREGGILRPQVIDTVTGELIPYVVDARVYCDSCGYEVVLTIKNVELDIEFEVKSISDEA